MTKERMSGFRQHNKGGALNLELIECTRQPGRLRISKQACSLRYLRAHGRNTEMYGKGGVALEFSFTVCRNCPQGHRYAEELKKC